MIPFIGFSQKTIEKAAIPVVANANVTFTPECCVDASGKFTGQIRFKMSGTASYAKFIVSTSTGTDAVINFVNNTYSECFSGKITITIVNNYNSSTPPVGNIIINGVTNNVYQYTKRKLDCVILKEAPPKPLDLRKIN